MKTFAISVLLIVMLVLGCEVTVGSIDVPQYFSAKNVEIRANGVASLLKK